MNWLEDRGIRVVAVDTTDHEALAKMLAKILGGEDPQDCPGRGTGRCCHDVHYDTEALPAEARAALPHNHKHLCGEDMGKSAGYSTDPDEVTCGPCRERIFA